MSQFGAWFYETLQDCFEIHYGWNLNECMGKAATGSNKYYVDWTAATCVKDCSTGADCEGLAESWGKKSAAFIVCGMISNIVWNRRFHLECRVRARDQDNIAALHWSCFGVNPLFLVELQ